MKTTAWLAAGLLTLGAVVGFGLKGVPAQGQQPLPTIVVYKSSACGCCQNWVEHMRAAGFETNVQNVENIGEVKGTYGVSEKLAACHTALAGGYVIEGHVPADTIKRLLRERPPGAGVAAPGMPKSAPGMDMPGEPYRVMLFSVLGISSVYEQR